jgi:acyl transferase domain-containing protein
VPTDTHIEVAADCVVLQFFSIPSEDAKAIDPQQRFLLEVSYEALENGSCQPWMFARSSLIRFLAGIRKEDVDGSDTAVYVGSFVKGLAPTQTSPSGGS